MIIYLVDYIRAKRGFTEKIIAKENSSNFLSNGNIKKSVTLFNAHRSVTMVMSSIYDRFFCEND